MIGSLNGYDFKGARLDRAPSGEWSIVLIFDHDRLKVLQDSSLANLLPADLREMRLGQYEARTTLANATDTITAVAAAGAYLSGLAVVMQNDLKENKENDK